MAALCMHVVFSMRLATELSGSMAGHNLYSLTAPETVDGDAGTPFSTHRKILPSPGCAQAYYMVRASPVLGAGPFGTTDRIVPSPWSSIPDSGHRVKCLES